MAGPKTSYEPPRFVRSESSTLAPERTRMVLGTVLGVGGLPVARSSTRPMTTGLSGLKQGPPHVHAPRGRGEPTRDDLYRF